MKRFENLQKNMWKIWILQKVCAFHTDKVLYFRGKLVNLFARMRYAVREMEGTVCLVKMSLGVLIPK